MSLQVSGVLGAGPAGALRGRRLPLRLHILPEGTTAEVLYCLKCLFLLSILAQSLSVVAEQLAASNQASAAQASKQLQLDPTLDSSLAAAMRAVVGRFDDKSFSSMRLEEFEKSSKAAAA